MKTIVLHIDLEPYKIKINDNCTLEPSPHDVPVVLRLDKFLSDLNYIQHCIEFTYIGDEPKETWQINSKQTMQLVIGKNSRRVYGIEFQLQEYIDTLKQKNEFNLNNLLMLVLHKLIVAVNTLQYDTVRTEHAQHYQIIRDVLLANFQFIGELIA